MSKVIGEIPRNLSAKFQQTPYYAELAPYLGPRPPKPYTAEWYADIFDRSEPRYCEADLDALRAELARTRAAFLEYLQEAARCHGSQYGVPCPGECDCLRRMQRAIDGARP